MLRHVVGRRESLTVNDGDCGGNRETGVFGGGVVRGGRRKRLSGELPAAHEDQSSVLGEVSATHEEIDLLWERYYQGDTYCNINNRWSNEKEEEEEICDEGQQ
ncbi:hypothetical protein ACFE04_023494 [Oxalis oulophora]